MSSKEPFDSRGLHIAYFGSDGKGNCNEDDSGD